MICRLFSPNTTSRRKLFTLSGFCCSKCNIAVGECSPKALCRNHGPRLQFRVTTRWVMQLEMGAAPRLPAKAVYEYKVSVVTPQRATFTEFRGHSRCDEPAVFDR